MTDANNVQQQPAPCPPVNQKSDDTVLLNTFLLAGKPYRVLYCSGKLIWERQKDQKG